MATKVVVGLSYGDEGKGVVTDYLCSLNPKNTAVVRFSGGHQCGHKVIRDGVEHVFSNFGSGTLLGCPTYWSEYCTFEPVGFWNEYQILKAKGITPKIIIHPNAPVVTPYDIIANENGIEREHGTTGTGFYQTKKRHFDCGIQLDVKSLLIDIDKTATRLSYIQDYYGTPPDQEAFVEFFKARAAILYLMDE